MILFVGVFTAICVGPGSGVTERKMWFLCLNQSCDDELGFHIWVECNVTAASTHFMYATLLGSCDPTSGRFSNECVLLFTGR